MKLPSLPTPHDVSDNQVAMETDPVSVISADSTTNFQGHYCYCFYLLVYVLKLLLILSDKSFQSC